MLDVLDTTQLQDKKVELVQFYKNPYLIEVCNGTKLWSPP